MNEPDEANSDAIEPTRPARPFVLTLVAIYQCVFAVLALLYFRQMWLLHLAHDPASLTTWDPFIENPFLFFLPPFAVFSIAMGWGIWRLQVWARHALIVTCGAALWTWFRNAGRYHSLILKTAEDRHTFIPFLVIDAVILLILILYPEIGKTFSDRQHDPSRSPLP